MSISFVQSNHNAVTTIAAAAYSSNNTASNFLVAVGRLTAGSGASAVTDTQGNTWTKLTEITNATSISSIWYAPNCKAGANTVTFNRATTVFVEFCIGEYSGIVLTSPQDQSAQAGPTTSNSGSVGPITPSIGSNLCIAMFSNETANSLTLTPGGGFTMRDNSLGNVPLLDKIQTNGAAATATCGFGVSVSWVGLIGDFKGLGTPNLLMMMGCGT